MQTVRKIDKDKNNVIGEINSLVGPLLDADLFRPPHYSDGACPRKGVPPLARGRGGFTNWIASRQFGHTQSWFSAEKRVRNRKGVDRMIKIYDTMTCSLRNLCPVKRGKVRTYVCSPTVYNYIHVGNARSTVTTQFVAILKYRGFGQYISIYECK